MVIRKRQKNRQHNGIWWLLFHSNVENTRRTASFHSKGDDGRKIRQLEHPPASYWKIRRWAAQTPYKPMVTSCARQDGYPMCSPRWSPHVLAKMVTPCAHISFKCGKHSQDRIISLKGGWWTKDSTTRTSTSKSGVKPHATNRLYPRASTFLTAPCAHQDVHPMCSPRLSSSFSS
jgi:hypothetical protein